MNKNLNDQLTEEILRARERIYHVNPPTPLEEVEINGIEAKIFLKREDLSAIKAYKWRGAYNAISMLSEGLWSHRRHTPIFYLRTRRKVGNLKNLNMNVSF